MTVQRKRGALRGKEAAALAQLENPTDAPVEPVGFCHHNEDQFPCSEDPITLVSMGLAASGLGLFMVLFLMQQVRFTMLVATYRTQRVFFF